MISQKRLHELLAYDPESGVFVWKKPTSNRAKVGQLAGYIDPSGYVSIRLDGKLYRAHRLAWLYVHGESPSTHLDHIDGCPTNNRIANLREVTEQQNGFNRGVPKHNTSGIKGVSWHKGAQKWVAHIHHGELEFHLGLFVDIEDAALMFEGAAKLLRGEFHRERKHGK